MTRQNPVFEALSNNHISLSRLAKTTGVSEGVLVEILHGLQLPIDQQALGGLATVLQRTPEQIQNDYEEWMYSQ